MPDDDEDVIQGGVIRGARTRIRFEVAQRRSQALQLRIAGASYPQIADALGYKNRGHVTQDVMRAIEALTREPAEEMRSLELARLDELQRAAWATALRGDVKAINAVLKVMERRHKLLGLDAPTKIDLSAIVRDIAEREGLPYEFAVEAANEIIRAAQRG